MARNFVAASAQYLYVNSSPIGSSGLVFTASCWFKLATLTATRPILDIHNSASTNHKHQLYVTSAGSFTAASADGSSNAIAVATVSPTTGSWYHGAGVWNGATSRAAYLNGGSKGTDTTSRSPAGMNKTNIGRTAAGSMQDGDLAEVAIWNVALTDEQVALLAKGVSPLMVQPQDLVFYAPLLGVHSPEIDIIGGAGLTVTGATKAVHPRIFYPGAPQTVHRVASNPQSVTPTTLALTTATFAPTVTATANQSVTPSVLAHTLATFAPTIAHGINTASPTALITTGFAPTITVDLQAIPSTLALSLATFAPTIVNPQSAEPGVLALSLTTFAPSLDLAVIPGVKALLLSTFAPTIQTPVLVTPDVLALLLSSFAPSIAVDYLASPGTLALSLATFAATLNLAIAMGAPTALVLSTFAPAPSVNFTVTPGTLALLLTTYGIYIVWPLWHPPVRVLLPEYRTFVTLPAYISRVILPSLQKPTKLVLPEYVSRVALEPYTTSVTIDGRPL